MKVAIFTLTRNRLSYTKRSFLSLQQRAGQRFEHHVVDNGSTDGTVDWLRDNERCFKSLTLLPENAGIPVASNIALRRIRKSACDLIVKMDNDCMIETDAILPKLTSAFLKLGFGSKCILSPHVAGVQHVPRFLCYSIGEHEIGVTGHVGGIFLAARSGMYRKYRYPEYLAKGRGSDSHVCMWMRRRGGLVGYVENLLVSHLTNIR